MELSEYSLWILFNGTSCFFWTVLKEECAILHVHTRHEAISVGTSTDDISRSCFYRQRFRKGILMTGHQSCVIVGKPLVSEAF